MVTICAHENLETVQVPRGAQRACGPERRQGIRYKYSGGLATYPQQQEPIAIYCPPVEKTFFVYGGTTARTAGDRQELLHMISCYDHRTGTVPRPRILLNKHTDDAHDNPVLSIDGPGRIWIFSPSHGTSRPSFIHRSVRLYDFTEFERVAVTNFSYAQPWFIPGRGFLLLHTRYAATAPGANGRRRAGPGRSGRFSKHQLSTTVQ